MGLADQDKSWKVPNRKIILNAFGIVILIVGLTVFAILYLGAEDNDPDVLGYEIIGGTAYPINPDDSKVYRRDMEMVGGKMYVLIDEFQRWFTGLWHGRSLALIIAAASILISSGLFYVARHLPPDDKDEHRSGAGAGEDA